ncbi:uncharacterized protein LOC129593496 [Paramacrobiotus metropolitanus]|uniref:uncharacterized protein LOC129593496 n=1 Tax=Paramacrobiotus metropolitanus TaxID=2943436 RepID=UPI0024463E2D|nr:uncharacterized protein LOC129593496 [Paramacrobiotus metropolitanus]
METSTADTSEIVFQSNGHPIRYSTPPFAVTIADKTEKIGDSICFILAVQKHGRPGSSPEELHVKRFPDDFRNLDKRLRNDTTENLPGVIAPRLSTKEISLVETVSDNNARFMGEYAAERNMFQRYLDAVLNHPLISQSKIVEDFVTLSDFSGYANFKVSLAKRLTGAVDEIKTSNYVDPHAFFQNRKVWLMKYSGSVADFYNVFTLQNICKKNLSAVMAVLSQMLNSNGHPKDPVSKLLGLSSDAIKQEEYGWHLAYWKGEVTLGIFLKHHIAQMDSFKDMMQQRTLILKECDSMKKTAEKAKPPKKEAAAAALQEAEKLVDQCSNTGKEEIERLDETEVKGFRQALIDYAESQIQAAQESYEILLEQIKRIQDWQPE